MVQIPVLIIFRVAITYLESTQWFCRVGMWGDAVPLMNIKSKSYFLYETRIIYKARNYVNRHTLRNLYYTFVYPYLTYCVEVWRNTCDSYL